MNPIEKRKQDLDQELYVNLVHQWKTQRPRRIQNNVVSFPVPTQPREGAPTPDGLTTGSACVILLAFLALTAVLIALGIAR